MGSSEKKCGSVIPSTIQSVKMIPWSTATGSERKSMGWTEKYAHQSTQFQARLIICFSPINQQFFFVSIWFHINVCINLSPLLIRLIKLILKFKLRYLVAMWLRANVTFWPHHSVSSCRKPQTLTSLNQDFFSTLMLNDSETRKLQQ